MEISLFVLGLFLGVAATDFIFGHLSDSQYTSEQNAKRALTEALTAIEALEDLEAIIKQDIMDNKEVGNSIKLAESEKGSKTVH